MGYPFGKDSVEVSPGVYRGTTPDGLQRVLGSLFYNEGIIPGMQSCEVHGTSGWSYVIEAGSVFMWTSSNESMGVLVPIEQTSIPTSPAPASGSRKDVIYVDSNGVVRVTNTQSIPEGVILDVFVVSAGMTGTSAATRAFDREYAIMSGSSMGRLHWFHDPAGGIWGNPAPMTLGAGRFFLPSDRTVSVNMTHCIASEIGKPSIMRWRLFIDGVQDIDFSTKADGQYPVINQYSHVRNLTAGVHTINYVQDAVNGVRFFHHKGASGNSNGATITGNFPGNRFEVWDMGGER